MIFHWTMLKPFLKAASQRIKSTNLEDKSMKQDAKTITMNILNGLSVGIIVALVPGAILNAIVKLLLPSFPQLAVVTYM
ncbi:MAG: hypothetical protein L0L99_09065, partial [Lacticaseibacillus paracasei]|nr:hypothetical protein [Lacticaseibacillus paracasei]